MWREGASAEHVEFVSAALRRERCASAPWEEATRQHTAVTCSWGAFRQPGQFTACEYLHLGPAVSPKNLTTCWGTTQGSWAAEHPASAPLPLPLLTLHTWCWGPSVSWTILHEKKATESVSGTWGLNDESPIEPTGILPFIEAWPGFTQKKRGESFSDFIQFG